MYRALDGSCELFGHSVEPFNQRLVATLGRFASDEPAVFCEPENSSHKLSGVLDLRHVTEL